MQLHISRDKTHSCLHQIGDVVATRCSQQVLMMRWKLIEYDLVVLLCYAASTARYCSWCMRIHQLQDHTSSTHETLFVGGAGANAIQQFDQHTELSDTVCGHVLIGPSAGKGEYQALAVATLAATGAPVSPG
jgi:hypothetical protein